MRISCSSPLASRPPPDVDVVGFIGVCGWKWGKKQVRDSELERVLVTESVREWSRCDALRCAKAGRSSKGDMARHLPSAVCESRRLGAFEASRANGFAGHAWSDNETAKKCSQ